MPGSYVNAQWGARVESVDEAADHIAQLLSALAKVDPALSGWRNQGGSRKQALIQPLVTMDHDDLVTRLLAARNRTDIGNQVIADLGYSVSWWNGGPEDGRPAAILRIHIGVSSLKNHVVLDLPKIDDSPILYDPDRARQLLRAVVSIFDPDSVLWSNRDLLAKQREPDRPTEDGRGIMSGRLVGQPAGWGTYLRHFNAVNFDPGLLPAGATVEHLDSGTLVLLGEHPADPPLDDVLQVRRAMGYQVPPPAQPTGAATANTTPPWTALTTPASTNPRTEHAADADSTPPTPDDSGTKAFGDQTTNRPVEGN